MTAVSGSPRAAVDRLLRGRGRFVDDVHVPGLHYVVIVRSPVAHARVASIDVRDALAVPGVVGVYTAEDLDAAVVAPFEYGNDTVLPATLELLARHRVRYAGQPVACVVADDRYRAEDAAELVLVDYKLLPVLVDTDDAVAPDAPLLHETWESNVAFAIDHDAGDGAAELAAAPHRLDEVLEVHRHAGAPIEPRGIVAVPDHRPGLTVHTSSHLPHFLLPMLVRTFGLDDRDVRVVADNIGGSFGTKTVPTSEELLVPALALTLQLPLKWIETRSENLIGFQAKQQRHRIEVGFDDTGRITAIRDHIDLDLGLYANTTGPLEGMNAAAFLPGCYDLPNLSISLRGIVTNKPPLGPYRGFGKSAPNFVIERVIDMIAAQLSLDPIVVRRRNLVRTFPHTSATGVVHDSGDYARSLDLLERGFDFDAWRAEKERARAVGLAIGIGVSCGIDPSGLVLRGPSAISAHDLATATISKHGSLLIRTGSCGGIGTSHDAVFGRLASSVLGLPAHDVRVEEGDTATCPPGQGAYSDRSAIYTANAVQSALMKLADRVRRIAGHVASVAPERVELRDSAAWVDGQQVATIAELSRLAYEEAAELAEDIEPGLTATGSFRLAATAKDFYPTSDGKALYPCIGNSAHAVAIEIDPEVGGVRILDYLVVHDAGRVLDERVVNGQVRGGVLAGIGAVLYEHLDYDAEGQLMNASFMDYLIPTSCEAPDIRIVHMESPSPTSPLGAKGVGESGAIASYGAVANAVADALRPLGGKVRQLPLDAERLWSTVATASRP